MEGFTVWGGGMEKERVKTHRQLRGVAEGSWRTPWMVCLSWNRKRQGLPKVQWVKVEGLCSSQDRLHAMTNKPWVLVASHNKSVFLFPSSPVNMGFREPSVVCSDQGLGLHTFYGCSRISESFSGSSAQLANTGKEKDCGGLCRRLQRPLLEVLLYITFACVPLAKPTPNCKRGWEISKHVYHPVGSACLVPGSASLEWVPSEHCWINVEMDITSFAPHDFSTRAET